MQNETETEKKLPTCTYCGTEVTEEDDMLDIMEEDIVDGGGWPDPGHLALHFDMDLNTAEQIVIEHMGNES